MRFLILQNNRGMAAPSGAVFMAHTWTETMLTGSWLSDANGQMNGRYHISSFREPTRDEQQHICNLLETLLMTQRDILNLMPEFKVGDYVYYSDGAHMSYPFMVLDIQEGHAFLVRPHLNETNGFDLITEPITKVRKLPQSTEIWLASHPRATPLYEAHLAKYTTAQKAAA